MNKIANPYVGPRTFEEKERGRFFGREREARELLALTVSGQLVLFYAQSGAGKSSLVNTCLIPDLKRKGFKVFPVVRVGGDAPSGLNVDNIYVFNLIRMLASKEVEGTSLATLSLCEFLAGQRTTSTVDLPPDDEEEVHERRVLIIDQFEELFNTHPEEWEKRRDFFSQLAQAMQEDPYLWVVLVMREDFIAALEPYEWMLPGRLRIRYYMQRLGREAALRSIRGPAEKLRPYAMGVAEKLVDDLCSIKVQKPDGTLDIQPGQYVEPVQLQVVCLNLWENLTWDNVSEKEAQITEKDREDVGDVNTSLGNYYAKRVEEVAKEKKVNERRIRKWIEEELIGPGGIRIQVLLERNGQAGGLDNHIIRALQSDLVRAEPRGGAIFYELTHDRLVEPIIVNNRTWLNENLSPLQRQAALWRDRERHEGWLLSGQTLAEVEQWAADHPEEMTQLENEFLSACHKLQAQIDERRAAERREQEMTRKLKGFSILAISVAVVAILIGAYAIILRGDAIESQTKAIKSQTEAQNAAATAQVLADTARARELASESDKAISESLDLSMLLSVEAYNARGENRNAQNVLFDNGQYATRLLGFLADSIKPADEFTYSPDGRFLVAVKKDGKYKNLVLWNLNEDLGEGRLLDNSRVNPYYFFSPDSKFLFYLDQEGINIWNLEENQKKEGEPINGHEGEVTEVIFNSNGETFATLGENGNVILSPTAETKRDRRSWRGDVTAFSPDGRKFAVFVLDKITVSNLVIQDKEPVVIERDPYSVTSMAFNQEGSLLAIADRDGIVDFWELGPVNEQGIAFPVPDFPPGAIIEKIAFHPNGNLAILISPRTSPDGSSLPAEVRILDGESRKQIGDPITGDRVVISPNGSFFVAWDEGSDMRIYDTETNTAYNENNRVKGTLAGFSWDAKTLAIFNREDNKLSLVSSSSGAQIGELLTQASDQSSPVESMAFSHDGGLLAVGFEDGSVAIWDVNRLTLDSKSDSSFDGAVTSLAFSPDGTQLIAGRRSGTISVWKRDLQFSDWKLDTLEPERSETNYPGQIKSINLSPDGRFLYSITNHSVALMDTTTGKPVYEPFPGNNPIFSADGKALAVLDTQTGSINLWNTSAPELVEIKADATEMSFSPKGQVLITLDRDNMTTLWNLKGDDLIEFQQKETVGYTLSRNEKFVIVNENNLIRDLLDVSTGSSRQKPVGQTYIGFSPGDNILITLSAPGQFALWNPSTGEPQGKPVQANAFVAFSPDEKFLLTSSGPDKLDIWETATGDPRSQEPSNGNEVRALNREGTRLITYSSSTSTHTLWNLTSLQKIGDLPGTFNRISPDGRIIVMSNPYGVSLWDFNSGKLIGNPIAGERPNVYFSSDGEILAITSYSYDYSYGYRFNVRIWDMVTRTPVGEPIQGDFRGLSPDGKILATGTSSSGGDLITLWDTSSGKQLGSSFRGISFIPAEGLNLKDVQRASFVISGVGETLAVFSPNGVLTLWDISRPSMPEDSVIQFETPIIHSLMSPNHDTIAVSSKDGIAFWKASTRSSTSNVLSNHIKEPSDIFLSPLSPDHKTFIANNKDGSLSLWEFASPEKPIISLSHETFCGFSPNGRIFVTAATYSATRYFSPCDPNFYSPVVAYIFRNTSTGNQIAEPLIGSYSSNSTDRPTYSFTQDGKFVMMQPHGASGFEILKIEGESENIKLTPVGETIPGTFQQFTPDGRLLIALHDNEYELWETEAQERTAKSIKSVQGTLWKISSDNQKAIFFTSLPNPDLSTNVYTFYFWDLMKSEPIDKIENVTDFPVISPKGTFMSIATGQGEYMVWNLANWSSRSIKGKPLGFSPDDKHLVVLDDSGDVPITTILSLPVDKGDEGIESFSGSFWGFGGQNNEVVIFNDEEAGGFILYDMESAARINQGPITADNLMLSPNKQFLASYHRGEVSLWNALRAGTGEPIITVSFDQLIGFSDDSRTFITIEDKEGISEISLLDTNTGDALHDEPFSYPGTLTGTRISADRQRFSVFGNGGIFSWDLTQPTDSPTRIVDPTGEVNHMVFSPTDDKILATVGDDGIYLWDVSGPEKPITPLLRGTTGRILDIGFSADGNQIVYLNSDGNIFSLDIADAAQPTEEAIYKVENACRMTLSPHGEYLAYIQVKKLHILNITDRQEHFKQEDEQNISCDGPLAFSENGSGLAVSEGNRIYIYARGEDGNFVKKAVFTGVSNKFTDLTYVLDDQILAVTGDDGRIFFWDVHDRALFGTFDQPGTAERFANGKLQIYLSSERRLIQIDFTKDKWQNRLDTWETNLCTKVRRHLEEDEWQQVSTELYPLKPDCPMPPPPDSNQ